MRERGAWAMYVLRIAFAECGGSAGHDTGVEGGEGKGEDGD